MPESCLTAYDCLKYMPRLPVMTVYITARNEWRNKKLSACILCYCCCLPAESFQLYFCWNFVLLLFPPITSVMAVCTRARPPSSSDVGSRPNLNLVPESTRSTLHQTTGGGWIIEQINSCLGSAETIPTQNTNMLLGSLWYNKYWYWSNGDGKEISNEKHDNSLQFYWIASDLNFSF